MNLYAIDEKETLAALQVHLSARKYHGHDIEEMFERITQHPAAMIASAVDECRADGVTCCHCGRQIVNEGGRWIDPEATGDDAVWRESCASNEAFTAEHEPES